MIRKVKSKKSTKAKAATKVQPLTKPSASVKTAFPVLGDFFDYDWKNIPLRHAFGVYSLCLYANLPDYGEVATESLTEGGDDKDCDLCLIDSEAGDAFIVQATVSNDWNKTTASTNKAEDLLTALSWLLKQPYNRIPSGIRPKAIELQEALARKEIKHLHLIFVHNCKQSREVEEALATVATSAKTLLGDPAITVTATEIIENNNTQNAIKAFDIRSNDSVQRRLQTEFSSGGIVYLHRRQGAQRLRESAIQAETLAPFLAAFHGKFQIANRQRRTIFEDSSTYGEVFPPQISAHHVLLIQALSVAISNYKLELVAREKQSTLNDPEQTLHTFLQFSTSKLFVIGVVGRLASQIVGQALPELFAWKVAASHFKDNWRSSLVSRWKPIVEALVPIIVLQIEGDMQGCGSLTSGTRQACAQSWLADKVAAVPVRYRNEPDP